MYLFTVLGEPLPIFPKSQTVGNEVFEARAGFFDQYANQGGITSAKPHTHDIFVKGFKILFRSLVPHQGLKAPPFGHR